MRNNIMFSTNCKYRTAATQYTPKTFVCFGYIIVNILHKEDIIIIIIIIWVSAVGFYFYLVAFRAKSHSLSNFPAVYACLTQHPLSILHASCAHTGIPLQLCLFIFFLFFGNTNHSSHFKTITFPPPPAFVTGSVCTSAYI